MYVEQEALRQCVIEDNSILDITEQGIDDFIVENRKEPSELSGYCWPIDYQSESDLKEYLIVNSYRYYKIFSSYGLSGWILAKNMKQCMNLS